MSTQRGHLRSLPGIIVDKAVQLPQDTEYRQGRVQGYYDAAAIVGVETHDHTGVPQLVEATLLLAAQEGRSDEVERLVTTLLPGERRALADACDRLAKALRRELKR